MVRLHISWFSLPGWWWGTPRWTTTDQVKFHKPSQILHHPWMEFYKVLVILFLKFNSPLAKSQIFQIILIDILAPHHLQILFFCLIINRIMDYDTVTAHDAIGKVRLWKNKPGLSIPAITCNTCYAVVFLMDPWCCLEDTSFLSMQAQVDF